MSEQGLLLLRRIVLHNKLVPEMELDAVLAQAPGVEQAVKQLLATGMMPEKTAAQVLSLYQKQLQKSSDGSAATAPAVKGAPSPAKPAAAPVQPPRPPASTAPTAPRPSVFKPQERKVAADPKADDFLARVMGGKSDTSGPLPDFIAATTGASSHSAPAGSAASGPVITHEAPPPEAELVLGLLRKARELKASDIHIKSNEVPLVRVAGSLRNLELPPLAPDECERSLLAILEPAQRNEFLATSELDLCYEGGPELGRFRTNYLRQLHGMDGVFRLIPNELPTFEQLNMPPAVKRFTEYRQGIVLVTGPKSCGKTTTLAAMIDLINRVRADHIITIEDPIEFIHPSKKSHVNQREVGPHTKTFGTALRAALREAPDVIMVGELRDLETTALAITAAETGHLVLATLHTPDAARTIGRVLDVFPPKEQGQIRSMISESLRGVVSQVLIPSIDGNSLELAVEILVNTTAIGNMIRDDRTFQLRGTMQTGKKLGMQLLDDSLIQLAKERKISKEDALSRAVETPHVEKELAAVR